MPNFILEDDIEQALLQRLQHLYGYDALICSTADPNNLNDGPGRSDKRQVILHDRLKTAVTPNASSPDEMLSQNRTRRNFAERLQEIIDTYNAGCSSADHSRRKKNVTSAKVSPKTNSKSTTSSARTR